MGRTWTADSEESLAAIAEELLQWAGPRRQFAFQAEMGAGKTTLIRHICEKLNCTETASSPTFALVQSYPSPRVGTVHHLDLYRLRDEREAFEAGIFEVLEEDGYVLVEWPEWLTPYLAEDHVTVRIAVDDAGVRTITAL
jgi:tRNA threonylcarbamoyladenosine biosynthesis protein TsaE